MHTERSGSEPERQVRFSSVPPSAPLFSFDVLEWSPGGGGGGGGGGASRSLSQLYARRSGSEQRLGSRASVGSSDERVDPRDRAAFSPTAGTWTCFRSLACCGDVLVLSDTALVDVGVARRHEFTWQQGPGRVPSSGAAASANASFGAHAGWRQTLALGSLGAGDGGGGASADMVPRESLLCHRRGAAPRQRLEVPLQDIHSIRRHCFQKPVPLLFNALGCTVTDGDGRGGEVDEDGDAARGDHNQWLLPPPPRRRRDGDRVGDGEGDGRLRWRYELWGPVGVIFALRGGRRLCLAFASAQHAEQMEELLIDFAAGAGLGRRPQGSSRQAAQLRSPGASATLSQIPAWTSGDGMPSAAPGVSGSSFGVPLSPPQLPLSPSHSHATVHRVSGEASSYAGAATTAAAAAAAGPPSPRSFGGGSVRPSASAAHVVPLAMAGSLAPAASSPTRTTAAAAVPPPVAHARGAVGKVPGGGYLYCRPWGEAARHRRYYLKLSSAARPSHVVHLSRHRVQLWQRLQHALGNEPRCVSLDLRRTTVAASATHDRVLRVTSLVDSFAQFKDVVPLGGEVGLASAADESASVRAARRREVELCTGRPVVFEALAKSPAERSAWMTWFHCRGADVESAAHDAAAAPGRGRSAPFQPLGGERLLATSPAGGPGRGMLLSGTVDQWVSKCLVPATSASTCSSPEPRPIPAPQLPLKEQSASQRGGVAPASAAVPASSTSSQERESTAASPRPFSFAPVGVDSRAQPAAATAPVMEKRAVQDAAEEEEEEEPSIVVEDDERDGAPPLPSTRVRRSDPSILAHTLAPSRRDSVSTQLMEAARLLQDGAAFAPETMPTLAAIAGGAAAVYLKDTSSSTSSSSSRGSASPAVTHESPPQLPATNVNSPQSPPPSTAAPTRQASSTSRREPKALSRKGSVGSPSPPLPTTATPLAATQAPPVDASSAVGEWASPQPPPSPPPRPPQPSHLHQEPQLQLQKSASGVSSRSAGSSHSVKSDAQGAAAVTALLSLVATLSQRAPSRSQSPDAPPGAAPAAALRDIARAAPAATAAAAAVERRASSAGVTPPPRPSSLGSEDAPAHHVDPADVPVQTARAMQDTSSSSSTASSLLVPVASSSAARGELVTPAAAASAEGARVRGGPSPTSSAARRAVDAGVSPTDVDPRLSQFLEHLSQHDADGGGSDGSGGRLLAKTTSTPFDLHHVLPSEHREDVAAEAASMASRSPSKSSATGSLRGTPIHPSMSSAEAAVAAAAPNATSSSYSRADGEHSGGPLTPESRATMERRRRAFRNSLFIHQA
ncbi:hypothetical protein NESM_000167800 [Novymonas esmeraldas]|uniref:PH domain-containing protein n=1 Tax=Novymonas esmeraldas TaxID=1808958 RepID=A0AAW0F3B9_9TRYP